MGEPAHDVAVNITEEQSTKPKVKRTADFLIFTSPSTFVLFHTPDPAYRRKQPEPIPSGKFDFVPT
jgi:uncharacterized NAD-dependent epimerase/dehydratase family protein